MAPAMAEWDGTKAGLRKLMGVREGDLVFAEKISPLLRAFVVNDGCLTGVMWPYTGPLLIAQATPETNGNSQEEYEDIVNLDAALLGLNACRYRKTQEVQVVRHGPRMGEQLPVKWRCCNCGNTMKLDHDGPYENGIDKCPRCKCWLLLPLEATRSLEERHQDAVEKLKSDEYELYGGYYF